MAIKTSMMQLLRSPVKLIAFLLASALASAMLCVGLNLSANAKANIKAADEVFTTIAVPEVYTPRGRLVRSLTREERDKYTDPETGILKMPPELTETVLMPAAVTEEKLDITDLRNAPGASLIDMRMRFGAWVKGENQLSFGMDCNRFPGLDDIIIFTYDGEVPLVIQPGSGKAQIPLTVSFSASPFYKYSGSLTLFTERMLPEMLSASAVGLPEMFDLGSEYLPGSFVLEPGKQYIVMLSWVEPSQSYGADGAFIESGAVSSAMLSTDPFHNPRNFPYSKQSLRQSTAFGLSLDNTAIMPYLPIDEYSDGFFETEQGAYFTEAIEALKINTNSLTAITTRDMGAMRPFHNGNVFISEGRAFTREEYDAGERVCVVSSAMAQLNGWELGDTLQLAFYDCEPEQYNDDPDNINPTMEWHYSAYTDETDGFFDEGEYTIVGMFDGHVEQYQRKEYNSDIDKLHMVHCIIPESSVENAPEPYLYKYTTSIRLDNDKAIDFINHIQSSPLMAPPEGEPTPFELRLTVYDQGYSFVAPGLTQLSRISGITLICAIAVAGLAVVVLSLVQALRCRRELAIMRMLGTPRRKALVIALAAVALVCALGAGIGAYAGSAISTEVAQKVVESADENAADTTFTAMMGEDKSNEFDFTLESDPALAIAAFAAVSAAFLLLSLVFIAPQTKRSPMALLGEKEE